VEAPRRTLSRRPDRRGRPAGGNATRRLLEPVEITRRSGRSTCASLGVDAGMAHTLARGLHIEQFSPANRGFDARPSNPRAEVRLLTGPSWLFMRNLVCDAGYMRLRGAGVRPLKSAGDRLSGARTGAHRADEGLKRDSPRGTPDRSSQPSLLSSSADICPASADVGPRRPSPRRARTPGFTVASGQHNLNG
jgi:hypothetical protein